MYHVFHTYEPSDSLDQWLLHFFSVHTQATVRLKSGPFNGNEVEKEYEDICKLHK